MSLANVLVTSQVAKSVVLLGDPQQLEQPRKGHIRLCGRVGAGAHSARADDHSEGARDFPAGDVANGAEYLRVHVGAVL